MYTSCINDRDTEKLSNSPNDSSHHLKFNNDVKTKKNWTLGEANMRGYQKKHTKQGYGCYTVKSFIFSFDKNFQRYTYPALPGSERETLSQMVLINVTVSYKRVTSTRFSELCLCLLLLKNNPYKMILCQRGIFWGGKFCFLLLIHYFFLPIHRISTWIQPHFIKF